MQTTIKDRDELNALARRVTAAQVAQVGTFTLRLQHVIPDDRACSADLLRHGSVSTGYSVAHARPLEAVAVDYETPGDWTHLIRVARWRELDGHRTGGVYQVWLAVIAEPACDECGVGDPDDEGSCDGCLATSGAAR